MYILGANVFIHLDMAPVEIQNLSYHLRRAWKQSVAVPFKQKRVAVLISGSGKLQLTTCFILFLDSPPLGILLMRVQASCHSKILMRLFSNFKVFASLCALFLIRFGPRH